MNKLCKTCKHALALIKMAFLCIGRMMKSQSGEKTVKQPGSGGTYLHRTWGITGFLSGKTPETARFFCERNGKRIILTPFGPGHCEQTTSCTVFNDKSVIKIFSRSGFE
jgi:hypothetical protein